MSLSSDQIVEDFLRLINARISMFYFHELFNRYHWEQFNYLEKLENLTYHALKTIYIALFRQYRELHRTSKKQLQRFIQFSQDDWERLEEKFGISDFHQLEQIYVQMYQSPDQTIRKLSLLFENLNIPIQLSEQITLFFTKCLQKRQLQHMILDEDLPTQHPISFHLQPNQVQISLQIHTDQVMEDVMVKVIGNNHIMHLQNGTPLVTSSYFEIIPELEDFLDLMPLSLSLTDIDKHPSAKLFILVMKNNRIHHLQCLFLAQN